MNSNIEKMKVGDTVVWKGERHTIASIGLGKDFYI